MRLSLLSAAFGRSSFRPTKCLASCARDPHRNSRRSSCFVRYNLQNYVKLPSIERHENPLIGQTDMSKLIGVFLQLLVKNAPENETSNVESTDDMGPRPSWEANSRSVTQEFPNILWNLKVPYRVHKSPSLIPILSQMNPLHATQSYFSKIISVLSSHQRLDLSSGLFPSGFPPKPCMWFLPPHACYMPCPSHAPWVEHCNYIWQRVQVMKLLIMHFSPASCYFISLGSKL
jgi:hypothetical protein